MSDKILKALVQLFAIIGKSGEIEGSASRNTVASFLRQALNKEQVKEYMDLYDEFLKIHENNNAGEKKIKRTAVSSVKVLVICEQINEALSQKQKVLVLVRLIEYIYSSDNVDEQELEFINTVYSSFRISDEEFSLIYRFITEAESFDHEDLLVLSEQHHSAYQHTKTMQVDHLQGDLRVIRVPSVELYFIKYFGVMELTLNGNTISDYGIHQMSNGSSIRGAKIQPVYYSDIISRFLNDRLVNPISFQVNAIAYNFPDGKRGLHPLSFEENSGKLIGIMGGSGAGKSTLLNIINGNAHPSEGTVKINAIDLHQDKAKLEGMIGFVSQDDLLMEDLTVYQNLFFNAQLSFSDLSEDEIKKRVDQTLNDLGLFEIKHLKVGSPLEKIISGGQRKRLNIALELIREPGVLFVDEPTSGLSSRDSEIIIDLLKILALKGKVVFVVIHQPSSDIFKVFDRLLILDKGGYPIYLGNPVDALTHFKLAVNYLNPNESECILCGNVNPELVFNIIETRVLDENGMPTKDRKISPQEWNQIFLEKNQSDIISHEQINHSFHNSYRKPGLFKQFSVFVKRDVCSKLSNTQYLLLNLLEAPILAFILAFMTRYQKQGQSYNLYDNKNLVAFIFMSVIVALFMGLMVSAEEIFKDKKIRKREAFLNLSKGAYLWSKFTILFVISAIQTFLFVLIGNTIIGIHGMFAEYWLMLFCISLFANALGLNISSAFKSAVTIYIVIPFLIIPQLLLSGLLVKFDELNPSLSSRSIVPKSGEIMASRWAFEGLTVHQFIHNAYEKNIYPIKQRSVNASFMKGLWCNKMLELLELYQKNKHDECASTLLYELQKEGYTSNQIEVNDVKKFIEATKTKYSEAYRNANELLDNYFASQSKTEGARSQLEALKFANHNEQLEQLVKSANSIDEGIYAENDALHPSENNIYFYPSKNSMIRAHFYAPAKYFMGSYYPTFWVNVIVILLMTVLCYVALYFDLLNKGMNGIQLIFEKITPNKQRDSD